LPTAVGERVEQLGDDHGIIVAPLRSAVGPQQFLRQLPLANTINALTCGFLGQPTQLIRDNSLVEVRAVLRCV